MNRHQLKAIEIAEKIPGLLTFEVGNAEKQVAGRIECFLKGFGAKPAFPAIVASGSRASRPHGAPTRKKIRRGEMLLVDFGALYRGWRSDLTRTFFIGGPSARFRKIYRVVKKAQEKAIGAVRAGIECRKVDGAARDYIKARGFGRYFIHSTGHGVGRRVHEPPKISSKNRNRLKAGQVITIEPGIYIKGWGGVRIEDMVLVTKKGCKVLTR